MPDSATVESFEQNAFRIGDHVYVPALGVIRTERETIRLEPRLVRLLDLFIDNAGRDLGRHMILDRVWPDSGSDEALTQAVSRLRQYLGRDAIRTLPRIGYALATTPEPLMLEDAPDDAPRHTFAGRLSGVRRFRTGTAFFAGLATGIALAVMLAPVLMTRQIEIEETVSGPSGETRLIRTTADCSLAARDCLPSDRRR